MNAAELAALTRLCTQLGSPPAQAAVMAAQLLKRADQLAADRGRPREEMLDRLLRLMVQGRTGEVPEEFPATRPPDERKETP